MGSTGQVHLPATVFSESHPVRLKNTLFIRETSKKLRSVQEIAKQGIRIVFKAQQCTLIDCNKKVVGVEQIKKDDLYLFKTVRNFCATLSHAKLPQKNEI